MPEPYWGILEKAIDDDELIEAAIERIFQSHNFFKNVALWGMLYKALDDDQTIAQAIAAAIATHETDPDSHTGEGEALETHKAQEVVDHPIGSVVADKLSHTELVAEANFESLDAWTITGTVTLQGWTRVSLYIETGGVEISKIVSLVDGPDEFIDFTKNMLFQTILYLTDKTNKKAFLMFGKYTNDTTMTGFGFEIVNGVVKGFWQNSVGLQKTADLGINAEAIHVFRAQYSAANKKVSFYIDGVLKGSITDANINGITAEGWVSYILKTNGETDGSMIIKNVIISRQI